MAESWRACRALSARAAEAQAHRSSRLCEQHHGAPPGSLQSQAEARQRQFEQSAVGRAALKSVKDAKRVEQRPSGAGASAQDWMS